jgi:uncharacterized protein GlcG (DUF336 family)
VNAGPYPGDVNHDTHTDPSRYRDHFRLGACPPAAAQLLQHKDLSLSIALAIANGALDACKAMGYAASVVVVDRGGDTLVSLRGDGSGPHTVENARRKAYTANTFKMTTEAFIQDMKTRPVRREQTTLPHVTRSTVAYLSRLAMT